MASGSNLRIGTGFGPCTSEVQLADEFTLDGRPVTLIDTPGFDDTGTSDTDILKSIAVFLAKTCVFFVFFFLFFCLLTLSIPRLTRYENGSKLSGVIYLHRISDERFTGIAERNFKAFRKLCGDSTLKNVVIVTNMWGEVVWDVGKAREKGLIDSFLKPFLDKGGQLASHHNTAQCAHDIIRFIMKTQPIAPQIRRELVLMLPPARPSTRDSDTWYDGLLGVSPPTPFLIPSRLEQVETNRMASPELRPSSRPGYSPQNVLDCAKDTIIDTGSSALVSNLLLAYNNPTVDQSRPGGLSSTAILPYPAAMESQVATFPPNWRKIPQEVYKPRQRQWGFTPSEPIFFNVNGHPGVSIGDALRENFTGLKGRDDHVLLGVGDAISCRLLVRLSW